jgi:hypothetical protein
MINIQGPGEYKELGVFIILKSPRFLVCLGGFPLVFALIPYFFQ